MAKKTEQPDKTTKTGEVKPREITEEMKESYIDYAMSVIVSRALPDVRDGLKPVHRRILYAMNEDGLRHNAKFRKSATVVGSTLGRYHPHGDQAVYDALVRMAQDFSLRYPLIQGQGNFGCFTKNTRVRLCDGRDLNFGELIKEQKKGKRHWTFTFNPQTKKIEVAEIKNPRLTRKKEKIIEITLDNGEKIKCTLDHRFMLRDGTYREAQNLKPSDSLMPLYAKAYDGKRNRNLKEYEITFQPIENALNYFDSFSEIVANSQKYNHKVVKTKILQKREDVYDLTIEPWHNFALAAEVFVHNSIDGDSQAQMRYTEARLSELGEETLKDIEKDTVDLIDNYDGTRKEPTVLPSPLPQLLLNGALGIAVGMATNILPHNLSEVCDACIYLIDHPKVTTPDLFEYIQGPDFPTGGIIYNKKEIIQAYSQGKGPIIARGKTEIIEDEKRGRYQIIITEIPFQVQKSSLVQQFAKLVSEKKITGIKDIRDESDREGLRIVIDLQKGAFPQKILNRLYKFSDLQKTFHLNMLALVAGIQPKILSLVDILSHFISHRKEVVFRRTKYDLERAKMRAHVLEGLHKCLGKIDDVIKTIKSSADRQEAQKNLMKKFKLTEIQANAILETKLSALAKLERQKITKELEEIKVKIEELTAILKSPLRIKSVIKKELKEIKEKYGDERRTKVVSPKLGVIDEADLIPKEETIITLTQGGYIKRINPKVYKIQRRGGKGILGMETRQDDIVEHFLLAETHDSLLFFTDSGKVFRTKAYEIPEAPRVARGRGIMNFLEISPQEKVLSLFHLGKEDFDMGIKYLIMVTKKGIIKKVELKEFENVRRTGLIAISLKKGDALCKVQKTSGKDNVILVTKKGQSIRFRETDIRPMGRTAAGVRGIRLKREDEVIGMDIIKSKIKHASTAVRRRGENQTCLNGSSPKRRKSKTKQYLLVVSENGSGKRTDVKEYRLQGRGGTGIKTMNVTQKTGNIVTSKVLTGKEEDLIVVSRKGQVIRIKIGSISKLSRATQGVRIMRLSEGDRVASATCI